MNENKPTRKQIDVIRQLGNAIKGLADAIRQLVEHIRKVWKDIKADIKDFIADVANIPKKNKKPARYTQTKWAALQNIRMQNQVLNNKPRHLVKKIIR